MKKSGFIPVLLLVLCLVAGVLTGNAEEEIPLSERVRALLSDGEALVVLYPDDLEDLTGIGEEDCVDFAYLASRNPLSGREVIVLLAADGEAADRVEKLLQDYLESRRHETRNYLPEAYALLNRAEVTRTGLWVLLVIGGNAEEEIPLLTAF